jgi:hypothetical protein
MLPLIDYIKFSTLVKLIDLNFSSIGHNAKNLLFLLE